VKSMTRAAMATEDASRRAWQAVPFGSEASHVEVDFSDLAPQSVTAVLCTCLRDANQQPPSAEQVWQWPITTRLQGLLTVVMASQNRPLSVDAECPSCQEQLSFDLPLEDFVKDAAKQVTRQTLQCTLANGTDIQLRLPTGLDQQRWLQQGWSQQSGSQQGQADFQTIAQDLLLDAEAIAGNQSGTEGWVEQVEAVLEEADPLTALELEAQCPNCQAEIRSPFNLELNLLQRLRGVLTEMLRNVNQLALSYHWSEAEILNLPAQRRDFYLRCLRREV
jgi:hypothetical protein